MEIDNISNPLNQDTNAVKQVRRQTGPKSIAGKNRSRWNALKDGATAKSAVLPFEDERLYRRHIREVEQALNPSNYVEAQLVREYAEGLWRITRHEKRGAYERDHILDRITPAMVAQMLELPQQYISCAPVYLTNLKYKISAKEAAWAKRMLALHQHLLNNAKGIANYQMVWAQYQDLYRALGDWMQEIDPNSTPFIGSLGTGINLPWQQKPDSILKLLERFTNQLFFVAHFESFKPAIRVWMESWFFLQKSEMRRLEQDDQILLKERNSVNTVLDRLMRIRKSNMYLVSVPAPLSLHSPANHEVYAENEMEKRPEKSNA